MSLARVTCADVTEMRRVYGGPMVSGKKPPNSMSVAPAVMLEQVATGTELAQHLSWLRARAGMSLAHVERGADRLIKAKAAHVVALPRSTVSDLCAGKSIPQSETLRTFLLVCGVPEGEIDVWQAARDRVANAGHRPDGAVRVRDADPRLLGVHASIQPRAGVDELPVYVPRDLDADVRSALAVIRDRGGMVLLAGESSVGKTRAMFEAVRVVLPGWWLLHPQDSTSIDTFARAPAPNTVLWLDELQRYLDAGLTAGTVRTLLAAGAVIAATLWPDEYTTRIAPRVPGRDDPHAEDRSILELARVVDVPATFTPSERDRAQQLADTDPRLQIALDSADAGVTQVLAAGPELIRRWENAGHVYGKAVITAALDARRVGARALLSRQFLEDAGTAYLDSRHRACAPDDWLTTALDYATTPLHGAIACLTPHSATVGQVDGYSTADYLHQHASRVRRTMPVPQTVWHALVVHHHATDSVTIGNNAERRGQPDHAIALYKRAAIDTGSRYVFDRLVDLLVEHGRIDEAITVRRQLADADPTSAFDRLVDLLVEHGRIDEAITVLRQRADAGYYSAAFQLADLLAGQGHIDEAITIHRQHADAGNWFAASRLVDQLAECGRIDEIRQRADAGDLHAVDRLVDLLAEQGHIDEAITIQRRQADAGGSFAVGRLVDLLTEHGRVDEAITFLRQRADAGPYSTAGLDDSPANLLVDLLTKHGRLEEAVTVLRQHADAGDTSAVGRLVNLFAEHGRVDEAITVLRQRADSGDWSAFLQQADLLAEQGRVDEAITVLRPRAHAGSSFAVDQLVDLLAEHGRVDEAITILRQRVDAGDHSGFATRHLADLLAKHGRVDEVITVLRQRADSGDWSAFLQQADLLAQFGRHDEAITLLRQRSDAGDHGGTVTRKLAELLAKHGRVDELRRRADAGDYSYAAALVDLLAEHGRIEELRQEVHAGTYGAVEKLAEVGAVQMERNTRDRCP